MTPKIAVWASRHRYPADLHDLLPGVDILHVRGRWQSAEDCYFDALLAAQRQPDVVFFVLPTYMRHRFVEYVQRMNPDALLIRPMLLPGGEQVYSRAWWDGRRVCWEKWEPEGVRG